MAAVVTITAPGSRQTTTLALTGGPLSVLVNFYITVPGTGGQVVMPVMTDGTGAATVTCVPQGSGTLVVQVGQPRADNPVHGPMSVQIQ